MVFHRWRAGGRTWGAIKPLARSKRSDATRAEAALWQQLRNRGLQGYKFRRQHGVGRYVVDFICAEARLVVEVDGPVHRARGAEDAQREQHLRAQGLHILRVTNEDVRDRMENVLQRIAAALDEAAKQTPFDA